MPINPQSSYKLLNSTSIPSPQEEAVDSFFGMVCSQSVQR